MPLCAELLSELVAHAQGRPRVPVAALLASLTEARTSLGFRVSEGPEATGHLTGLAALPLEARTYFEQEYGQRVRKTLGHVVALVWPGQGDANGRSVPPLTPDVPRLVREVPHIGPLLYAVDVLRVGQARERKAVAAWLERELTWAMPARLALPGVEVTASESSWEGVTLRLRRGNRQRFHVIPQAPLRTDLAWQHLWLDNVLLAAKDL